VIFPHHCRLQVVVFQKAPHGSKNSEFMGIKREELREEKEKNYAVENFLSGVSVFGTIVRRRRFAS